MIIITSYFIYVYLLLWKLWNINLGLVNWDKFDYINRLITLFMHSLREPVTKIKNIKTDATKILKPTHFSWSKNIKTDGFFVGLNLWLFFFQIRLVGLRIYLLSILENKTGRHIPVRPLRACGMWRLPHKLARCSEGMSHVQKTCWHDHQAVSHRNKN